MITTLTLPTASLARRAAAKFIDLVLLAAFAGVLVWFSTTQRAASSAAVVLFAAVNVVYHIGTTAWLGGTLGKCLCQLRVCDRTGAPVCLRGAVRRHAVPALWSILDAAAMVTAISGMPDAVFADATLAAWRAALAANMPSWGVWAERASHAWLLANAAVLVVDRQRRSLNDFLAHTIVVHTAPQDADGARVVAPT